MRFSPGLLLAVSAALLSTACASNRYCLEEQKYERAENRPTLTTVDGLKLPESATALRIPPPPPASVPFGVRDDKGGGVCLDKPVEMTPAKS